MKKLILHCQFIIIALGVCSTASAQSFTGIYTFANVTTTTGKTDPTPVPVATGVGFGSFHVVGNSNANPNSGGRFNFTGWPTASTINLSEYFEVIITPQANYALTLNTMNLTVQRSGTGVSQFSVRSNGDNYNANLPASFAGTEYTVDASNVFKIVATSTTAAIANLKITFNNIINATTPDTIRIYGWGASGSGGTFSLNRAEFSGMAAPLAGTPVLTLDTNFIRFPSTYFNSSSPALRYMVKGASLTSDVTVTASAPFAVSDALNGPYSSSLTLPAADVTTPRPVFVQFSPAAAGLFTGTITNTSSGATPLTVSLAGQGVDATSRTFNFNSCTALGTPASGFITYSVTGAQGWACSQYGNNGSNGVDINGYSGSALDNEDWLVSAPLSVGSLSAPVLSFYSRGEFTGPSLQLLVSTDYDGYSNPNNATWTDLQAAFPPLTNTWTITDGINLSAYQSYPRFYLAFKYTSSPDLGAARWTLDDVNITDRSKLLSTALTALNFGEVASGASSAGQAIGVQGFGYGTITVTAPGSYQVSADNNVFSAAIQLDAAAVQNGTTIYARFSPTAKALKTEGKIRFAGEGLDSAIVSVTGSSYPKAETFDVGAYNLSFFGSNSTNNPTPQKITTQINNIATVFQHLNLDVAGVEEVSSDSAMNVLVSKLPGYAAVLSNRWSYSFDPPDPTYPPQKTGFLYNTATMHLVDTRDMFEGLFDSVRYNLTTLPGYPDSPSHFWASGRLPFMATFDVLIGGISKRVRVIDIHAKASSDASSYNRRVYDAKVLKDSLDTYYKDDNIIIVGDYNDRVYGSIYTGGVSPYNIFVADPAKYSVLTYPLDSAGRVSFISGTGLIDQITISNELSANSIPGSTDIEDARTYISSYNANTASDHLPVFTRLSLSEQSSLPVQLTYFKASPQGGQVLVSWQTAQENNNSHFEIERSADGRNFYSIATVAGAGTTSAPHSYQHIDSIPLNGTGYYRLRQVDADGKSTYSAVVAVNINNAADKFMLYPNPVTNYLQLTGLPAATEYTAQINTTDGKALLQAKGRVDRINQLLNQQIGQLKTGVYIFTISSQYTHYNTKFIKE